MKCDNCGSEKDLLDATNDQGEKVKICKRCYNLLCEGYELVENKQA